MSSQPPPAGAPSRHPALWLTLIILLGLGIRLTGLIWGQAYFYFGQGDAVEAYSVAVDYGLGSARAMYIGQPNYNQHSKLPGPWWTAFCYGCYRLWGTMEGVVLGVILLNTAVIGLTYVLTQKTIGPRAALWAALFTATFPWVVYYSIGVYNPEVMSFLGALLFLALWQTARVDRAGSIFFVPLLLLLMPQFHMSGLILLPAVVLVLVVCPARLGYGWLAGGIACGLALYVPYIRGELAHGWQNTRGMFTGDGAGYSWDSLKALSAPLSFLVNWAPRWTRSAAEYRELGRACFGFFGVFLAVNLLSAIMATFFVGGAFLELRKALRGFLASPRATFARSPGVSFLTILLVVPLVLALVAGKPFHTRYCIVLIPVMLPLVAAGGVHWLSSARLGRSFRLGVILLCCANVWMMPAMYRFQGMQIEGGPVLIPSFRKLETVYGSLKGHAGPGFRVQVDDTAYVKDRAVPKPLREAAAILRRFVEVREKEEPIPGGEPKIAVYRLCSAAQTPANGQGVAYRSNGIALVAVAPEP